MNYGEMSADPGAVVYAASETGIIVRAYTINEIANMSPFFYHLLHPAQKGWIQAVIQDFVGWVEFVIVGHTMSDIDRVFSSYGEDGQLWFLGLCCVSLENACLFGKARQLKPKRTYLTNFAAH